MLHNACPHAACIVGHAGVGLVAHGALSGSILRMNRLIRDDVQVMHVGLVITAVSGPPGTAQAIGRAGASRALPPWRHLGPFQDQRRAGKRQIHAITST